MDVQFRAQAGTMSIRAGSTEFIGIRVAAQRGRRRRDNLSSLGGRLKPSAFFQ